MTSTSTIELNIVRMIWPYWLAIGMILAVVLSFFYGWVAVYSTVLGSLFSLLGLYQLSQDQAHILIQNNRKKVFISFLFRLAIYAVPIIASLKFPNYFKFWIILICLFKSQVIFIVIELITNYKNYKQRMAKNG
ncbi:MAG: hypothetical protein ACO3K7_00155 [Candidatus Marinamargulisbacteria bacterium]